ncbi:MAG TPA: multiheme c-type cytochrome [Blastocatellia bacterium]|nr:multiheme c-type cytochrome [Blastocatellia bacterium]
MRKNRTIKLALLSALALCAVQYTFSRAQKQRMWMPNKTPATATFIGTQACAECHGDKVKSHAQTMMGRALEPVATSEILTKYTKLTFRAGPYQFEIRRDGERSLYSVTDGKETMTLPILYAFGLGHAGQTYVLQGQDGLYESRLSFYNDIQGLDTTIGQSRAVPVSLNDAVGRLMPKDETLQCFSCHTTGTVKGGKIDYQNLVAGIGCEACHGPGGEHVELGKKGEANAHKIFNPGKLSADDLSQEFCAACHRSVEDVTALPRLGGMNNVRFQPYRIFNSKCYSDDRRISCIACHNVHQPMKQEAAAYDANCAACHADKAAPIRKCKVESKNCTSCHMPKIELPGAHFKFTDHRIRIVKPGEPFPF